MTEGDSSRLVGYVIQLWIQKEKSKGCVQCQRNFPEQFVIQQGCKKGGNRLCCEAYLVWLKGGCYCCAIFVLFSAILGSSATSILLSSNSQILSIL